MADFIQTFRLDEKLVDFINSNLTLGEPNDNIKTLSVYIPELEDPLKTMIKEYLDIIEEYNYFADVSKLKFQFEFNILYISPWIFRMWKSESGKNFNFYIFLKDSDLVYEFFNPFIRKTVRYKASKGLVIIVPSIWLIVSRHTSTRATDAVLIVGTTYITDLDNVHETRSSNIFSETTMMHG